MVELDCKSCGSKGFKSPAALGSHRALACRGKALKRARPDDDKGCRHPEVEEHDGAIASGPPDMPSKEEALYSPSTDPSDDDFGLLFQELQT
jgi:hypothetical protein